MALEEYKKKRNFRRTPEPAGKVRYAPAEAPLEFVIQKHDASHLHYDFRLELDGVLKSWAVPKGPSLKPSVKRLAMHVEDHPMDYGGFEGIIPANQYGGGTVMLWDRGSWIPEGDPRKAYRKGRLKFRLEGEKLSGRWNLVRMRPKPGEKKESWLLIKESDETAREAGDPDITDDEPLSVATGRSLDEIAAEEDRVWDSRKGEVEGVGSKSKSKAGAGAGVEAPALPRKPQLATLVGKAPGGGEWIHELKFDGYRVLVPYDGVEARIITRNGKDWTHRFEGLAAALRGLSCESAVLDGEVVALDARGLSRFQLLQNAASGTPAGPPVLYAFDLLELDGRDLRNEPIEERKAELERLVARSGVDRLRYSDHVVGKGEAFFDRACEMGVEGIISKRLGRPYRAGRGKDWVKVKCTSRQELVIAGFTEPSGSRVGLGALLLAVHDEADGLRYAGKVGTGFDNDTLVRLRERLEGLEVDSPAVVDPPRGAEARGVHWVRPELVAEIEFTEWTDDGRIRHPSFQGLREDKEASEVVREEPGAGSTSGSAATSRIVDRSDGTIEAAGVRVSSPDRVIWAGQGVTKRDLVEYYMAVEEVLMPRIADRPLTLVRCPSGAQQECFFQKNAGDSIPDIVPRVDIRDSKGTAHYMYIDGLPSLLALVQIGVLEFHIWGSRRDRLDRPDRLVFDLDPDEALSFGRVAGAALDLRDRLADLGLRSFVKSTGGKGLHVVVPVERRRDWTEAKAFTQAVAQAMVADEPDAYTAKMTKSRRTGRIFVDYLRNAANSTAIADYSTRARPGAPVSVPMAWEELSRRSRKPPEWSVRDVPSRVAEIGDPWAGYDDVRQSITRDMERAVGLD